ncbi:hypothetical protein BC936DRAFT_138076 [Jimgerdemannia flammicorona]|uniref:Alpha/Beta hydrolase protein n=1 Tax=Jimgerdemannia flammicorona TaxID=994334 RepID=A0A433DMV0_9FUNG|nr:hypothetical protein BC936DRAFT_138076 [Jimgerdemannia flammicorona]
MERIRIAVWFLLVVAIYAPLVVAKTTEKYIAVGHYDFPYFSNHDLGTKNSSITKLVLVIHGIGRNAIDYYNLLYGIAQTANTLSKTAIVAPHFLCPSDNPKPPSHVLSFSCDGWLQGLASVNTNKIYSFTALDQLLTAGVAAFPHLTEILVAGHSAGGQTVQRYGASTTKGKTEVLGTPVKYVAANPGTYMYLDNKRVAHPAHQHLKSLCPAPGGNECHLTASDFVGPYWNADSCPGYNDGKYGLGKPEGYIASVGRDAVIHQFPKSNFTYLLGDLDTQLGNALDVSCEANATGYYRKQRGLIWEKYLYLTQKVSPTTQVFHIVPGCGHNDTCMFQSAAFLAEMNS